MIFFYAALMETEEQRSKFEAIYEKYYGLMYHVAFSITRNPHHAGDCVHETCLTLIDKIDELRVDAEKEFISYLCTLTRRRSIDYLRKWRRGEGDATDDTDDTVESVGSTASPEDVTLSGIHLEQALEQLSRMPEMYRGL